MKNVILNLDEVSDSSEVYDSKPHPFLFYFIIIIAILLVSAFLWMAYFNIDIVVKASGVINIDSTIQQDTSKVSGIVKKCYVQDNKFVSRGDLLYEINHDEIDKQISYYEEQINDIDKHIEIMNVYIDSIENDVNKLDDYKGNIYYNEYLCKYNLYINKINTIKEQDKLEQVNNNFEIKAKLVNLNIEELLLTEKISAYSEIDTSKSNKEKIKEEIDKLKQENEVNQNEIDEQISCYEEKIDDIENYIEIIYAYIDSIENNVNKLDYYKDNMYYNEYLCKYNLYNNKYDTIKEQNKLEETKTNSKLIDLSIQELLLTEKSSVYSEIETNKSNKDNIIEELDKLKQEREKYFSYAKNEGYVNFKNDLNEIDYISAGMNILEITPDSEEYYVNIYINSQKIGEVKEGMIVKYKTSSFTSNSYTNEIDGKISSISKTSKSTDKDGNNYYLVKAEIDNNLKDSKGKRIILKDNMYCQVDIVVGNQSILKYLLKKINILD